MSGGLAADRGPRHQQPGIVGSPANRLNVTKTKSHYEEINLKKSSN